MVYRRKIGMNLVIHAKYPPHWQLLFCQNEKENSILHYAQLASSKRVKVDANRILPTTNIIGVLQFFDLNIKNFTNTLDLLWLQSINLEDFWFQKRKENSILFLLTICSFFVVVDQLSLAKNFLNTTKKNAENYTVRFLL